MKLRVFFWKLHRWIGLVCALPFAVLVITGIGLLVCHATGGGSGPRLDHRAANEAGIDIAVAAIGADHEAMAPGIILANPNAHNSWLANVRKPGGGQLTVPFDPETGRLFRPQTGGSTLRETLLAIHNSLLMGITGKIVALMTSVAVLMLAITGFAIMRRRLRTLITAPWRGPSLLAAWHKWLGLAGLLFLLLWTISGFLLLGFKTLGEFGRSGPPRSVMARSAPAASRAPLRPMLEAALSRYPGTEIQAVVPGNGKGPVMVMLLDRQAAPWRKSRTVSFEAQTGAMSPARPVPAFMQVMIAAKSLHTGLWDGPIVLGLYLLAAIVPLVLVVTGPWLWWRRRPTKRHS